MAGLARGRRGRAREHQASGNTANEWWKLVLRTGQRNVVRAAPGPNRRSQAGLGEAGRRQTINTGCAGQRARRRRWRAAEDMEHQMRMEGSDVAQAAREGRERRHRGGIERGYEREMCWTGRLTLAWDELCVVGRYEGTSRLPNSALCPLGDRQGSEVVQAR